MIVAQPLIPGSTTAAAHTATPVVRTRDRVTPAPSTRIAVVSDEVQDQTSGRTAGEATTRNRRVSPGIIVAVAGRMSTRRNGGATGVNTPARSEVPQPAVTTAPSQSTMSVEVRYDGISIGLTTGVVLRRFK